VAFAWSGVKFLMLIFLFLLIRSWCFCLRAFLKSVIFSSTSQGAGGGCQLEFFYVYLFLVG
jgi:hypothetical protein